jgi:MFS family permease
VIVPGTLLFAAALLILATRMGPTPHYWTVLFPASILTGIGVGFSISTLGSAANAFLPPTRFAMGSAFNATCRQVGAALGIAIAVALLGQPGRPDAAAAFDRTWVVLATTSLAAGAVMLLFYRRPVTADHEAVVLPV